MIEADVGFNPRPHAGANAEGEIMTAPQQGFNPRPHAGANACDPIILDVV